MYLIPSELLKSNKSNGFQYWHHFAPILIPLIASLRTGALAILVPIFKKRKRDDPANYKPNNLINVISNLYANHLHDKLKDWLDQGNLIAEEQVGFVKSKGTINQCLVLQHLIKNYSTNNAVLLYAAFIDLKAVLIIRPRPNYGES